jgi:hypothetical protein
MNTHVMRALAALLAMWVSSSGVSRAASEPPAPANATPANNAAALYDAGNAEARLGHPALAVLDYERARLLAPKDPDIAANLAKVRESAGLPPQTGGWLESHERFASPNLMYWLGVLGLACAGVSLLILRARRVAARQNPAAPRLKAVLRLVAVGGGLVTLLSVGDALATNSLLHEYVVLDTAPATGSPVSNGAPLFTVSQADVVHAREQHQGFLLVTDSQGRQGWVANTHLAAVVAQSGPGSS